ncbi:MAG: diacylglycerol kinase (ATP) [Planctomycetaceae bacterium]
MIRPWVGIQRNPRSGSGKRRRFLFDLASALKRHDLRPHIFSRRELLAARLKDPERRAALVGIVAAGGDGTLTDVANRFPGVPACPFPLGTENLLAKYLGIPLDGEVAARILAARNLRKFDVGQAGSGTKFLIMGSVGFDAEVIRRLHESRRGNISHLSYVLPICRSAMQYSFPKLTVTADGLPEPIEGSLVVVSNFPAYAFKLPVNPDAVPDDGLLTVRVFQKPGRWNFAKYSEMVTRRLHLNRPDVRVFRTSEVTIESEGAAPVQIDGDPFGSTPVSFRCLPGELELFVPESFS